MTRLLVQTAIVASIFFLSACGGSSGSSDTGNTASPETPSTTDNELPTASITFPPRAGLWSSTADTIIRGTAGDNAGVEGVTVNGVEASSDDGFLTWSAKVLLDPGVVTEINVSVTDVNGNESARAASTLINGYEQFDSYKFCGPVAYNPSQQVAYVFNPLTRVDLATSTETRVQKDLAEVSAAAFDADANRFLVIQQDDLLALNTEFQEIEVLSSAQSNTVSFGAHPQIVLDNASGFVYVLNPWSSYLVKVDPATGGRTKIGNWQKSDGFIVTDARNGIVLSGGRFFVLRENSLVELNLLTSEVTEISGPTVGSGPAFDMLSGLSVDVAFGKAYVGDAYSEIFEVDLATGDRTLISSETAGIEENLHFASLRHSFIDTGPVIQVNSCLHGKTFTIDKKTGQRKLVSKNIRGAGPLLMNLEAAFFDSYQQRILLANEAWSGKREVSWQLEGIQQIVSVDPTTGNRSVVTGPYTGQGGSLQAIDDIAADSRNGVIYVSERLFDSIVSINPQSGDRSLLSGNGKGTGPELGGIRGIAVDETRNRLLVLAWISGEGDVLMAVNLEDGNREILTGAGNFANSDSWQSPAYISVDSEDNFAYIVDYMGAVFRVDMTTGQAHLFSGRGIGAGPELHEPANVALDKRHNRIILTNYIPRENDEQPINMELLAINLSNGDRASLMNVVQRRNERMVLAPAVDNTTGLIYISMPNQSLSVLDAGSGQYLTVSQ